VLQNQGGMHEDAHVAVEEQHAADQQQAKGRQLPRACGAEAHCVQHRRSQIVSGNRLREGGGGWS
jgi:hypothetical protein